MSEYWYFISVWACVLCGRTEEIRERRYGPRPERWEDRHEYVEGACRPSQGSRPACGTPRAPKRSMPRR